MCRWIAFTLLLLSTTLFSSAQLKFSEGELMVLSRHAWRGERLGKSVSIEPSVTATAGAFSFNVWAAVTPDNSYSEIDLIPSWQFRYFQLSLLDYYNPVPGEKNRYLNFSEELNRHSVEMTLDNYSIEKQRLKWLAGTFILGDKDEDTGKACYSTYIEFSYPFTILGIDTEPFAGFTPFNGLYAEKFSFVNTGVNLGKEIELNDTFSIPLLLSLVHNPSNQNSFVTFAAGIAF